MNDIIFEILKLVVMIAGLLIARYVVPWVKLKMENEEVKEMMVWAEKAVLMAQQVYEHKTGPERKEIVVHYLKEILAEKNIVMTDEQIDVLIEAAVKSMKMTDLGLLEAGTTISTRKTVKSQKKAK